MCFLYLLMVESVFYVYFLMVCLCFNRVCVVQDCT